MCCFLKRREKLTIGINFGIVSFWILSLLWSWRIVYKAHMFYDFEEINMYLIVSSLIASFYIIVLIFRNYSLLKMTMPFLLGALYALGFYILGLHSVINFIIPCVIYFFIYKLPNGASNVCTR